MAITQPERHRTMRRGLALASVLSVMASPSLAQSARTTAAQMPAPPIDASSATVAAVTPTLTTRIEHNDNVFLTPDTATTAKRSDVLVSVLPSITFRTGSPHNQLVGSMGLIAEHTLNNSLSDRVVPNGMLDFFNDRLGGGAGVAAQVSARQIKPRVTSVTSSGRTDSTENQASITPFIDRQIDDKTWFRGAIRGRYAQTEPRDSTAPSSRSQSATEGVHILRKPSPFGYALDVESVQENTRVNAGESVGGVNAQTSTGETLRSSTKATVLYAINTELDVGVIAGAERDRRNLTVMPGTGAMNTREVRVSGGFAGALFRWRPNGRTQLYALVEDHQLSTTWEINGAHRLGQWTVTARGSQQTLRQADSSGPTSLLFTDRPPAGEVGMSLARPPVMRNNAAFAGASTGDAASTNTLAVYQTLAVRMAYTGARVTASVGATSFRSTPLRGLDLPTSAEVNRITDAMVTHRLTPLTSFYGNVRWGRSSDQQSRKQRETALGAGLVIRVSRSSAMTFGMTRARSLLLQSAATAEQKTNTNTLFFSLSQRF